jgi:hypothetical protein
MSKPELKPVKPEVEAEADPLIETISTPPPPPDPFDLEKLRLDQKFVESAGVKKLLTKVPVQKPDPQSFVRVHPGENYRMALAVIVLKEDSETFLLLPHIARDLPGEFVMVMMHTVITRQGTIFLWPIRLPDADGKINEWHQSAAYAAEYAAKRWVRIKANKAIRGYELIDTDRPPDRPLPEPTWPDLSFQEIVRIAFRDRLVDRPDHAVIKRLRGAA